jgi:hypothetical protein
MNLVPLIDLKFLNEFAAVMQELQIGGTSMQTAQLPLARAGDKSLP